MAPYDIRCMSASILMILKQTQSSELLPNSAASAVKNVIHYAIQTLEFLIPEDQSAKSVLAADLREESSSIFLVY